MSADETRTSPDCKVQRIVQIVASLDCGSAADRTSRYGGMQSCRASGSAQYTFDLLSGGGHLRGSGIYTGQMSASLEFFSDPKLIWPGIAYGNPSFTGFQFTSRLAVAGSFEGEAGTFHTSGTEERVLESHVYTKETSFRDGQREIFFDKDQETQLEGGDCAGAPLSGLRHMKLRLTSTNQVATPDPSPTLGARAVIPTAMPSRYVTRPNPVSRPTPSAEPGAVRSDVVVGRSPLGVAVDPVRHRAYVANSGSGTVSVVDVTTEEVMRTLTVGVAPQSVAVNKTTGTAYVTNQGSASITVIDGRAGVVLGNIPVDIRPSGVATNSTTERVYVASNERGTLTTIDSSTNRVLTTTRVGSAPVGVAVDEVANVVFVANNGDGSVSAVDGSTGGLLATVPVGRPGGGTNNLAIDASRGILYVTDNVSRQLWVVNANTLAVIVSIPLRGEPWSVAVSETWNRVYVGKSSGGIDVIDGEALRVIATLPVGSTHGLAIDPESQRVYFTGYNSATLSILK